MLGALCREEIFQCSTNESACLTLPPDGFYTGDSSYSIAWLALGNRTGSDAQFGRAFLYMNGLPSNDSTIRVIAPQDNPFHVWKEQARDGNHLNL